MRELSIFIDESGDIGSGSKYYLLSLVFHDQSIDIDNWLTSYERSCIEGDLPHHTFHFTPILRGHPPFGSLDFSTRKALLGRFRFFVEKLPFKYAMFSYEKRHFIDTEDLQRHMQLDISNFILDSLDFFQRYEQIKIYYDNGQSIVSKSVHGAIDATLFNGAIVYRDIKPSNYRLFQVADYVCGIELAALHFDRNEVGASEKRFFGARKHFSQNYLKKLRRKRLR